MLLQKLRLHSTRLANFFHNIASTYSDFGKFDKAAIYFEKALNICRIGFGARHPKSIITAGSLINVLVNLGKSERAGKLAAEFLSYVPQNHSNRLLFEHYGKFYKKKKDRHKKRRH